MPFISIHAAREGGDGIIRAGCKLIRIFQSTPPVKAATCCIKYPQDNTEISIHAAREGGDGLFCSSCLQAAISIHAAREGGDASSVPVAN